MENFNDQKLFYRIGLFLRKLFKRRIVIVGAVFTILFVFMAIAAPLLSPYDPYLVNPIRTLEKPSLEHWLGTDNVGRDVLSRIIYGSSTSLAIGVVAVMISAAAGVTLGLISGYIGGKFDVIITRLMDAIMAIPMVMLALALGMIIGGGLFNIMIILGIATIPSYTRMMRGQVLSIKETDYITAARVLGASRFRVMFQHVMPNCFSPIIILITRNVGMTILAESSLSFLGLGINPPMASWGGMVKDGYTQMLTNPTLGLAPGVCVLMLVIGLNILGDGLRDVLDPRLRGSI